jgi:TRAP-type mannitol/chloroaromatic compound transport system permease small subunit
MPEPEHKEERYFHKILRGSARAGWVAFVLMMVWGTADVIGALLGHSIPATTAWTEILNVIGLALPLAYVTSIKGHINVELFNMRGKTKRVSDCIVLILVFLFISLLAWQLSRQAWRSIHIWEFDQVIIKIYWFPAKIALALGFMGSAIVVLFQIIGKLLRRKEG